MQLRSGSVLKKFLIYPLIRISRLSFDQRNFSKQSYTEIDISSAVAPFLTTNKYDVSKPSSDDLLRNIKGASNVLKSVPPFFILKQVNRVFKSSTNVERLKILTDQNYVIFMRHLEKTSIFYSPRQCVDILRYLQVIGYTSKSSIVSQYLCLMKYHINNLTFVDLAKLSKVMKAWNDSFGTSSNLVVILFEACKQRLLLDLNDYSLRNVPVLILIDFTMIFSFDENEEAYGILLGEIVRQRKFLRTFKAKEWLRYFQHKNNKPSMPVKFACCYSFLTNLSHLSVGDIIDILKLFNELNIFDSDLFKMFTLIAFNSLDFTLQELESICDLFAAVGFIHCEELQKKISIIYSNRGSTFKMSEKLQSLSSSCDDYIGFDDVAELRKELHERRKFQESLREKTKDRETKRKKQGKIFFDEAQTEDMWSFH